MSDRRYWRVVFSPEGRVLDVVEITFGDGQKDWLIVEAPDQAAAKRKAFNLYCARKKRLAKARKHAEGHCACGRKQDRLHPSGEPMLTCSTCAERQKCWQDAHKKRVAAGTADTHVRDEAARVAKCQARQRDRRAELRLETLLDVRKQWIEARNVGLFGKWLEREIEALTKGLPDLAGVDDGVASALVEHGAATEGELG